MAINTDTSTNRRRFQWGNAIVVLGLIIAVFAGAYVRLVGVNWDEDQHMHPDERFLSLVQVAISPVENPADYFNTAESSLNPANRGYSYFVYGTLPIFIIRYLGEALGQTDYNTITIVGRYASAAFDLMTVLLVFAVGKRLYGKWVGLLGALFYALAVLPIQLSHFMTVDTFTNTFAFLAVFAASWALTRQPKAGSGLISSADNQSEPAQSEPPFDFQQVGRIIRDLGPYLLFGVALGAATASKINAVVLAAILPLVEGMRYLGMDSEERNEAILPILRNLLVAAALSFLVFRIGQPYAFNGPGFLNFGIDENWWASLQSLRAQASGDVDFPPALQWARRPVTFSLHNLVAWGLGWPLGICAWTAFLGMGWQILRRRNWRIHLPLWAFTGLYFIWQSLSWVRSMRYQMLIYPSLAIFAAWGLVKLWSARWQIRLWFVRVKPLWVRVFGILVTVIVLLSTAAWAVAFSGIYTQPHTRVAASRWIYQNIPGALTLEMVTSEGAYQQPLPYRAGDTFSADENYRLPFIAPADGSLTAVTFPYVLDQNQLAGMKDLTLTVTSAQASDEVLATAMIESEFLPTDAEWRGASYDFVLNQPVFVTEGSLFYLTLDLENAETSLLLNGSPSLHLLSTGGMAIKSPLPRLMQSVRSDAAYSMSVILVESGVIQSVSVPYLVDQSGVTAEQELTLTLTDQNGVTTTASLQTDFSPREDVRGGAVVFDLQEPLTVVEGQPLTVSLTTNTPGARLVPHAPAPVHESSWDDAVPYPVDGFSPYSEGGGIYRGDLNFEMYWADNALKLEKFETNLDLADYVFITSSRQWGTTTRVPERYPLTTTYYRNLLGCPAGQDLEWCYSVAKPGMFEGNLGFELVEVFQSNPKLGPFEVNDQFAEEAFTVYDHPKVLIFKKTDAYDPIEMREILRAVDLSKVVYFTPGDAANYQGPTPDQMDDPRANLMLPEDRLAQQREGGTWSALFDRNKLINTSQPLAAAVFYLLVMVIGILSYPLVRLALPGLADRGYPLSKLAGLLLLAFVVWILGSFGVAFTRMTIMWVMIGIFILSVVLIIIQRKILLQDVKENWRYFLTVEALALIAFVVFIWIRAGNPDLWHPYKGGEKPMDFSYLNAVLKSTSFPPYDPWFAGGYINYYYYGFVIVGVPVKLLGIVPSVAYNIILPIWYSLLILGAFSVGWNLYQGIPRPRELHAGEGHGRRVLNMAFWVGLATAIGLAVLGNLGTLRLIYTGFKQIALGGVVPEDATRLQEFSWTVQGLIQYIKGTPLPFYPGDWYWFPSRVIPGEPITEFPFFTFIYADLHAHLIASPITIFAISWSLSVVLSKARWGEGNRRWMWLSGLASFFLGALVIGALRPTNTWDFYTYLVLAMLALIYSVFRHYKPRLNLEFKGGALLERAIAAVSAALLLALLAVLLYQPFSYWFGQGYTRVEVWEGTRTPLDSYFTHWGLFLFVIAGWMAWETYHWMKTTPQSALKKLEPYQAWIYAALILFFIVLVIFLVQGVVVALVALPLGVWAVILMLRPGRSDGGRFLLFLIGTAVTLTLVVEVIYLPGDIGRMNTVFKFYLQAWIMFALSSGVCFGWLIRSLRYWKDSLRFVWQLVMYFLVIATALFPLMGTADKIRDRMAPDAPKTLDGMAYMQYATYFDLGIEMQLEEDYQAIRWMQENVEGSPVILEGQAYEYRWGNRFTIYTGLPGVVGWNWHQRQQRAILRNNVVQERVDAVNLFYTTEDINYVKEYLEEHDVSYIVVGQLERIFYPGVGLDKFSQYDGVLWEEVFNYGSTTIYRVLEG